MSKFNRYATPAVALAVVMSIGSVLGLAQTNTGRAQSGQNSAAPYYGHMMGGAGPGMMGEGGMGPWMMGESGFGPAMCAAMARHVDGRLAFLKAELKITEAQEPLWKVYASAARDNANGMVGRCTTMMGFKATAEASLPDRLDLHEQFMAAQLDSLRAMNKALKPLYAAFSEGR